MDPPGDQRQRAAHWGRPPEPTPTASRRLEGEVVVFGLEGVGEFLEIAPLSGPRARLGASRRTIGVPATAATAAAQQDDLADIDLSHVPRLLVLVLVLPVLDPALDEELVALLDVLLDDVGEAGAA